jgi:hypothetical protein
LVLATALGGCGSSSPKLNPTTVERAIAGSILVQHGLHVVVACPADVPRRAGTQFKCTAHLEVGDYPVAAEVTSSSGHVRYSSAAPLVALDIARVRAAITASILAQRHLRATVTCPTQVLQQEGLAFTCTAVIGQRSYPFRVTQTDNHGHVRYVGY